MSQGDPPQSHQNDDDRTLLLIPGSLINAQNEGAQMPTTPSHSVTSTTQQPVRSSSSNEKQKLKGNQPGKDDRENETSLAGRDAPNLLPDEVPNKTALSDIPKSSKPKIKLEAANIASKGSSSNAVAPTTPHQFSSQREREEKLSLASPPPLSEGESINARRSLQPEAIPGAVAVAGFSPTASSSSIVYGDEEFQPHSSATTNNAASAFATADPSVMANPEDEPPIASSTDQVVVAEVVNDESIRQEIAAQVRQEMMQETVQASAMPFDDNEEPTNKTEEELLAEMRLKQRAKRHRSIIILLALAAIIIVGVVLGVVLSSKRSGNNSNTLPNDQGSLSPTTSSSPTTVPSVAPSSLPTTLPSASPSSAPTTSRCTLCYDGLQSIIPDLSVATVARTNQNCADLEWQPAVALESDACIVSQADAWLYCGCPLLPRRRPSNVSCYACTSSHRASGSSVLCPKYDSYVAMVGTPATCGQLRASFVLGKNCSCATFT